MNTRSELRKIAAILANEYPVAVSDRGIKAIDFLRKCIQEGEIYNVELKEAKSRLGNNFDNATESYTSQLDTSKKNLYSAFYMVFDSHFRLHFYLGFFKDLPII